MMPLGQQMRDERNIQLQFAVRRPGMKDPFELIHSESAPTGDYLLSQRFWRNQ